jgi:hypothetical protein
MPIVATAGRQWSEIMFLLSRFLQKNTINYTKRPIIKPDVNPIEITL